MCNSAPSATQGAHYAIMAVFGDKAKLYRCSISRSKPKQKLKMFPRTVLEVLPYHYRKFLIKKPDLIPKLVEAKGKKARRDQEDLVMSDSDVDEGLDPEVAAQLEEEKRKKDLETRITQACKGLPSLLADKATEIYRKEQRVLKKSGENEGVPPTTRRRPPFTSWHTGTQRVLQPSGQFSPLAGSTELTELDELSVILATPEGNETSSDNESLSPESKRAYTEHISNRYSEDEESLTDFDPYDT